MLRFTPERLTPRKSTVPMGMLARLASDPDRLAPIFPPPAGLGMEKTVVWSISP